MSSTIDEKVVEAKFDNQTFLRNVQSTLDAIGNLTKALQLDHVGKSVSSTFNNVRRDLKIDDSAKGVESSAGKIANAFAFVRKSLHLDGSTKSLESIPGSIDKASNAGKRFSLAPMLTAVSGVTKQFSVMEIAGVTAIATIAHQALVSAQQFVKGFTTAPLKQGLQEYETNLNAIQTILANTGLEGKKGLLEVNKALQDLNLYSDKTIYNFSQMARNIGTFTAAGVELDVATSAIKGIANLAAVSGSNADQASTAMYQLSQALASGTVKLMDWNSVVNAGMGGKVFQESLKETARRHGVAVDAIIKKEGSFRDSLQTGWLTSKILTETLAKFTGDLTEKQLKQMGYTDQQIKDILKLGKTATDAATKVKTWTQLVGTLKEAAGSGWARTWQLLVGDFGEARELFTGINDVLGGFIQHSADARNKVLEDWKKLGGRKVLIEGIGNLFKALISVLKPVRDGFREIFPRQTGKGLLELTTTLRDFTKSLIIGKDTANDIKRTFAGVFAIFSILGQVIGALRDSFDGLFGIVGTNASSFLDIIAGVGDWLVALDQMLEREGSIKSFFDGLEDGLDGVREFLSGIADAIARVFDSFDSGDAEKINTTLDTLQQRLHPIKALVEGIGNVFEGLGRILAKIGSAIKEELADIGNVFTSAFTSDNFNTTLDVINTSLLGGIVLLLRNFFNKGLGINFNNGMVGSIKTALEGVADTLKAMQMDIKANAILKIAGALALLTASIVVLAMIDSNKLTKALAVIGAGLIGLSAAMVFLSGQIDTLGTAKLVFISGAMVAISAALLTLSAAVKVMASIEAGDMYRGLFGLGLGLGVIAKVMKVMPTNMVLQAVALNAIATSLVILAGALKLFGSISWDAMAHGLAALAGSMGIIAGAMRLMPKNMIAQAVALTILAGALNLIAVAVKVFGTISWDEMLHGLVGIGGALVVIAGAMRLMPRGMIRQAVALVAISAALNVISLAIMSMSTMSWEKIAKGLVTLGGALLILAGGLTLMSGTLVGSAALLVASGALALLAPVLIALGAVPWSVLLKGLIALAGIFTVLGLAGLVLAPLVPVILGLSAAVVLIGAGLALAGVGALAFAAAFTAMTIAGAAGVSVLADILSTFIESIPNALVAFGIGIVKLAGEIAKGGPKFYDAFIAIITSILDAIIDSSPKIGEAFTTMVETALKVLVELTPKVTEAGLQMILGFLTAVDSKISNIVKTVISIVSKFITTLGENSPVIIQAGFDFIIDFINGLADAIRENSDELGEAGANLGMAIVEGMGKGLSAGAESVMDKVKDIAGGAINAAKGILGISSPSREFEKIGQFVNEGLAKGLRGNRSSVIEAYRTTAALLQEAIKSSAEDIRRAQDEITKLEKAKKRDSKKIAEARAALSQALRENALSKAAHNTLTKQLNDEKDKLAGLAKQYEKVTNKLEAARDALADAKQTRDDYNASIRDQYDDLPDITAETKLADFEKDIRKQIEDTLKFDKIIQQLRKLGLNDTLYKEFLEKGPAILPFLEELLVSGKTGVNDLNALGSELSRAASKLGKDASKALYQAAVDSAAGLVEGLKKQQKAIAAQMVRIADVMVAAIKSKLGIKSPSKEFEAVAGWSVAGLAKGLQKSSHISEKAAEGVGIAAILAMRKTLEGLSAVTDGMDIQPTITPVLDLTDVERRAGKLARLLPNQTIVVDAAYSSARDASAGYDENQWPDDRDERGPMEPRSITFIQNNTSPKALSEAELYRQTESQLAKAKGALTDVG